MDVTARLETNAPAGRVFEWIADLGRYPQWLDIVPSAVPDDPETDDEGPAWIVDLRARVGPLARSKRLRMVRTQHEPPTRVVFERREHDGRQHAPWVLTASVAEEDARATLQMHLHYGGRFFGKPLEMILAQEIERSKGRLVALL
jgi:uncharacterized protein YndB with AHSA1/START domain